MPMALAQVPVCVNPKSMKYIIPKPNHSIARPLPKEVASRSRGFGGAGTFRVREKPHYRIPFATRDTQADIRGTFLRIFPDVDIHSLTAGKHPSVAPMECRALRIEVGGDASVYDHVAFWFHVNPV
jgi:hypothetical protein